MLGNITDSTGFLVSADVAEKNDYFRKFLVDSYPDTTKEDILSKTQVIIVGAKDAADIEFFLINSRTASNRVWKCKKSGNNLFFTI